MCLQLIAPSQPYFIITSISTNTLTIARFNTATNKTETGGLRHAIVDNAKVLRHWEYYFQFSGITHQQLLMMYLTAVH